MTGQDISQFAAAVDGHVARLSEQHGYFSDSLTSIQAAIEARLRDDGLNYHLVKGRVKSPESVKGKLSKLGPEGSPKYPLTGWMTWTIFWAFALSPTLSLTLPTLFLR